jgi:hypothetical protein
MEVLAASYPPIGLEIGSSWQLNLELIRFRYVELKTRPYIEIGRQGRTGLFSR